METAPRPRFRVRTSNAREVKLREVADKDQGPWPEPSPAGSLEPPAKFDDNSVTTLSVAENISAETAVQTPYTMSMSDINDG